MKALIASLLLFGGCAGEAENVIGQEDREYRRADASTLAGETFDRRTQACAHANGALRVRRTSSGRLSPTSAELRMATCERRVGN